MHCGKAKRVALAILSHVIALGWKVIQRDQRKPSRLWDGGIGVAQLSDEAGMEAHAITLSRKVV